MTAVVYKDVYTRDELRDLGSKALASALDGALTVDVTQQDDAWGAVVHGPCPRCHHTFSAEYALTALVQDELDGHRRRGVTPNRMQVPVDITCVCKDDHPGHPKDVGGCGASFRVTRRVPIS